jgi:3-oxoacyl-[acyl-carrier protein] reductase
MPVGAECLRTVVVTGGARGIGAAIAAAFVEAGDRVVIADRDEAGATRTAAELGPLALPLALDVASESSVDTAFERVGRDFGSLDVLVNNAALMLDGDRPFRPFHQLSVADWQRTFAVNAIGVFLCTRAARPWLEAARGCVVNLASDAIWSGYAGQLAYFASKGAVAVMTRCLAREMGDAGVRVNAVAPGLTSSESVEASELLQMLKPKIVSERALQRDQSPADVAAVVKFLASDDARAVTGQIVPVNSGGFMR